MVFQHNSSTIVMLNQLREKKQVSKFEWSLMLSISHRCLDTFKHNEKMDLLCFTLFGKLA